MGRLVGIVILFCLLAQATTTFDLSADFSLRNNPNQAWQYGYSETNSLDPAQFRIDKSTGVLGQIGFWHPSVSDRPGPGYYPYVAYNRAKQTGLGSSNGWAARAGEVAMEASNSGQYSLIRFMAPAVLRKNWIHAKAGVAVTCYSCFDIHVVPAGEPSDSVLRRGARHWVRPDRCAFSFPSGGDR